MYAFDPIAARRAIADLPLTANQRRFADEWLIALGLDQWPDDFGAGEDMAAIMGGVVRFEVRPRQRVIWLGAGRAVNEGLGINMAGRDYTATVSGADRATRLARMTVVSSGCVSLQSRWVMNTAGRVHMLRELAVPCGVGPNGAPRMMTFVDVESGAHAGRLAPVRSSLGIATSFEAFPIN